VVLGVATFTGAVVGTPGFVAPELAAGDPRAIGPWSDIFSLAAVIFFAGLDAATHWTFSEIARFSPPPRRCGATQRSSSRRTPMT